MKFVKNDYLWFISYVISIGIILSSLIYLDGNNRLNIMLLGFGLMSFIAIGTMIKRTKYLNIIMDYEKNIKRYYCPKCGEYVTLEELDFDGYCKECNKKIRKETI